MTIDETFIDHSVLKIMGELGIWDLIDEDMHDYQIMTLGYIQGLKDLADELKIAIKMEAEQTEPQTERIKTPDYCDICNHKGCDNCIANNLDDYCVPSGYAPKDTPQTEERQELEAYRKCIKSRSFWDAKHCDDCYFYDDCPFNPREDEVEPNCSEIPNNSKERSE